jgi:sec-independent protein translocase protein TatA
MPGWISWWEILLLLGVILLIFGPKRLPELGRSLGRGAREFKDSITNRHDKEEKEEVAELPPPAAEPESTTAAPPERERDPVS